MKKLPAIFFGHGSPTNAIEENEYTKIWSQIAQKFPKPKAILSISAHWFVDETLVTANEKQKTIHDFYGFSKELFAVDYNTFGSPEIAQKICNKIANCKIDNSWGLDHGTWSVLKHLYPQADVSTLQLSINKNLTMQQHFELAKNLRFLRDENVLIIGSGNIVHNLSMLNWQGGKPYDWATKFNDEICNKLQSKNYSQILDYKKIEGAALSVPTSEHFIPLIYIIGALDENEKIEIFANKIEMASISMMGIISC